MTLTYYQVRPEGDTNEANWETVAAAALPQVVGSLTAGTYEVRALASSDWSAAVTVTAAATAPSAFTVGQWSLASSGDVTISALPADGGSAITDLEYRVNGGAAVSFAATTTGTYSTTATTADDVEVRAVNSVGAGAWSDVKAVSAAFDPVSLFGASDVGWIINAAENVDLYTDTAGTTPVTAVDQAVALCGTIGEDGLRRFVQTTSGNRPVYKTDASGGYLEFNGTDRWMIEQTPAWNTKDNITVAGWVEPLGAAGVRGVLVGHRIGSTDYAICEVPGYASGSVRLERRAGSVEGFSVGITAPATWAQSHDFVYQITKSGNKLTGEGILNGSATDVSPDKTGHANTFTGAAWNLGRRPSDNDRHFNGKIRRLVCISRALTTQERDDLRAWLIA